MRASRITLFAILLFGLEFATGVILAVVFGLENADVLATSQIIAGFVIPICVFGYMAWTDPDRPYLAAFLVGILATLAGAVSLAMLDEHMSLLNPARLAYDLFQTVVAVSVGVSLGVSIKRRHNRPT